MSHLGNPKNGRDASLSLTPCAQALSALLHRPVKMAPDCMGPEVEHLAKSLSAGEILMLENVRFYPAEENPTLDPTFAQQIAALGDVFVNDAFGTAHRCHSSTAVVPRYFPHTAAAGLLLQKENTAFQELLSAPKHPFYAIIGGAKIHSKIGVLKALAERVDALFIGGGMAFPFLKVRGISIGSSLCDSASLPLAEAFLNLCEQKKLTLFLPIDFVIADTFSNQANSQIVSAMQGIPEQWQGMDIGPSTIQQWRTALSAAETLFWNGPVGVFEFPRFSQGTSAIAHTLAALPSITVVGGGDSVAAINQWDLASGFTHISTGGGASLELIEKGHLPGIDALSDV